MEQLPDDSICVILSFLFQRELVRFSSTCKQFTRWLPRQNVYSKKFLCCCHRGWCDTLHPQCYHCQTNPVYPTKHRTTSQHLTLLDNQRISIGRTMKMVSRHRTDIYGNIDAKYIELHMLPKELVIYNYMKSVEEFILTWFPFLRFYFYIPMDSKSSLSGSLETFWEEKSEIEHYLQKFQDAHPWLRNANNRVVQPKYMWQTLQRPVWLLERMIQNIPTREDLLLFFNAIRKCFSQIQEPHSFRFKIEIISSIDQQHSNHDASQKMSSFCNPDLA